MTTIRVMTTRLISGEIPPQYRPLDTIQTITQPLA